MAYRLLDAAEREARDHECVYIRLEVRRDNEPAINLYRRATASSAFTAITTPTIWKRCAPGRRDTDPRRVPYYEQTLDFTCGPSALMMAMKALDPALELNRVLELRIWRESTTIFMTSGHGGCGPYGLALSAWRRGFDVELVLNDDRALFLDSVRSEEEGGAPSRPGRDAEGNRGNRYPGQLSRLRAGELTELVESGAIPVVLISSSGFTTRNFRIGSWSPGATKGSSTFMIHWSKPPSTPATPIASTCPSSRRTSSEWPATARPSSRPWSSPLGRINAECRPT